MAQKITFKLMYRRIQCLYFYCNFYINTALTQISSDFTSKIPQLACLYQITTHLVQQPMNGFREGEIQYLHTQLKVGPNGPIQIYIGLEPMVSQNKMTKLTFSFSFQQLSSQGNKLLFINSSYKNTLKQKIAAKGCTETKMEHLKPNPPLFSGNYRHITCGRFTLFSCAPQFLQSVGSPGKKKKKCETSTIHVPVDTICRVGVRAPHFQSVNTVQRLKFMLAWTKASTERVQSILKRICFTPQNQSQGLKPEKCKCTLSMDSLRIVHDPILWFGFLEAR